MALPPYGADEGIAAMVAYLAGPEAGYVTGASLRSMVVLWPEHQRQKSDFWQQVLI